MTVYYNKIYCIQLLLFCKRTATIKAIHIDIIARTPPETLNKAYFVHDIK